MFYVLRSWRELLKGRRVIQHPFVDEECERPALLQQGGGRSWAISRQSGGSSKHCCRDVNPSSACSKSSLCRFAMQQRFSLLRAAISPPLDYVFWHLKPVPRFLPSPKSLRHSQNTCQMSRGATELTEWICRKRFAVLKVFNFLRTSLFPLLPLNKQLWAMWYLSWKESIKMIQNC